MIVPFEQLQRDVAGEPVGDDDVGGAREQLARLRVSREADPGGLAQQRVRLDRQLVALLGLLADREQPHLGVGDAEDLRRRTPSP